MLKSRIGLLLGAVAVLLAVSPEARKAARRWAVKGTEAALDLADMAKDAGAAVQGRLRSMTAKGEDAFTSGPEQLH